MIGTGAKFRGALSGTSLTLELCSDTAAAFTLCPEYRLFTPNPSVVIQPDGTVGFCSELETKLYHSVFGERRDRELHKYARREKISGGWRIHVDLRDFGLEEARPFKMRILAGGTSWVKDPDAFCSLGLSRVAVGEYGWMIPAVQ